MAKRIPQNQAADEKAADDQAASDDNAAEDRAADNRAGEQDAPTGDGLGLSAAEAGAEPKIDEADAAADGEGQADDEAAAAQEDEPAADEPAADEPSTDGKAANGGGKPKGGKPKADKKKTAKKKPAAPAEAKPTDFSTMNAIVGPKRYRDWDPDERRPVEMEKTLFECPETGRREWRRERVAEAPADDSPQA